MSTNSILSAFALGCQSAQDVEATNIFTASAVTSGLIPEFDKDDVIYEHPSLSATRVFGKKAGAPIRTGYTVPFKAQFRLRPNFIGACLVALGYTPTTVAGSGFYTHTFVLTTPALFPWCSAFHADDDGGTSWERVSLNARMSKLSFDATYKRIQCDLEGKGLTEGDVSGTPTRTTETNDQLLSTIGSFIATVGGTPLTSLIRSLKLNLENEFDEEDFKLFQTARNGRTQQNAKGGGSLGGVDFTADLYKTLIRGSVGGTAPTLVVPTGPVSFSFESANNISGAAVPFSFSVAMSSTDFTLPSDISANGKDLIRTDINFEVNDDTEPITVTLVNNVPSYDA